MHTHTHTHTHRVPYTQTFNLWTFKDVNRGLHVQSRSVSSSHVSEFTCLVYTVMRVHLQAAVLSCTYCLYRLQWHKISISSPKCPEASLNAGVRWLVQYYLDWLGCFFQRADRIGTIKGPEPVPSASGVSESAACPPSPMVGDPPAPLPPTSPLLWSGALPACSLQASPGMPVAVLYCCTFQSAIRLKRFFFYLIFCVYVLFVWKVL